MRVEGLGRREGLGRAGVLRGGRGRYGSACVTGDRARTEVAVEIRVGDLGSVVARRGQAPPCIALPPRAHSPYRDPNTAHGR